MNNLLLFINSIGLVLGLLFLIIGLISNNNTELILPGIILTSIFGLILSMNLLWNKYIKYKKDKQLNFYNI